MTRAPSFDAIVIGGGLAGAGTARALAQRGLSVLVCESHPYLAPKASGNARGLIMPYVATHTSPPGRLYARGFKFTRDLLTTELNDLNLFEQCGALQLPATKRLARLITESTDCIGAPPIHRLNPKDATERAGITVSTPSFFFPDAGFCEPAKITRALIESAPQTITVWCSRHVPSFSRDGSGWRITLADGSSALGAYTVLCGAHEITSFPQTSWVPLEAIRGQTALATASPVSQTIRTVISYDGYITPSHEGVHFIGAHYRHNDMNETPTDEDTTEVLSRLYRTFPFISDLRVTSSRVCFRASTHDRMPYIGALPTQDNEGLFINAGHGSRGLITAPLGGEIIARHITNEPLNDLKESASIVAAARLSKRYESTISARHGERAPSQ
jgi:tRNA 5-methylaminomethyl-2-thiouridine biosynthesis bifunctional protein